MQGQDGEPNRMGRLTALNESVDFQLDGIQVVAIQSIPDLVQFVKELVFSFFVSFGPCPQGFSEFLHVDFLRHFASPLELWKTP